MQKQSLRFSIIMLLLLTVLTACKERIEKKKEKPHSEKPNIVVIYMDDLGYGDVSSYGAAGIQTPNIDRLAKGGIKFTSGYASSATCTPSRYALLTGVYPWRNKDAKILPGTAPLLIDTVQQTLPGILKKAGYYTGIVGKWHLGLGTGQVNWNRHVSPGPNEVGFDYSYIMAATQDRVPTVYIENGNVIGLDADDPIEVSYQHNFEGEPTGLDNPELLKMKWHHGHNNSIVNGISRIGFMKGGENAKWIDEEMAFQFLEKAELYIRNHKNRPFFLYYAMQQPHVPRTPHPRFAGTTGLGPRGDVIAEADWCIGKLLNTLEDEGILENTLIVFTSDNGPVLNDGYYDDAVEKLGDHKPAGSLRGGKYSLFDGGTRVPFITYWKGRITPQVSDAIVCQIDLLKSVSRLTGVETIGTDSRDMLDEFLGKSQKGRESLVLEATGRTALRMRNWIMIPPYKGTRINRQVTIETGNDNKYRLYNVRTDIGQEKNLVKTYPDTLEQMINRLESIKRSHKYNDF